MSGGQGGDRQAWAAGVADAFVALSQAVLGLGAALAGMDAMTEALDREVEGPLAAHLADAEDPAGHGVDEDPRRDPDEADPWRCPQGLPDGDCKAQHDHFPPPPKREG